MKAKKATMQFGVKINGKILIFDCDEGIIDHWEGSYDR
jgi:hypothetical protein